MQPPRTRAPSELNLVVDPAKAGPNVIHLYLLNRTSGQPAKAIAETTIDATLASKGIGPLRLEGRRLAPGHFVVFTAPLSIPGDWQLQVEARHGKFGLYVANVTVPIR